MSFASKYNKGTRFSIDTQDFAFVTLKDAYESDNKIFTVRGMFINKPTKYGTHATLITDDCFLSLPNHMTETIQAMLQDDQVSEVCNNAKLGVEIVTYTYVNNDEKMVGYSVRFFDK